MSEQVDRLREVLRTRLGAIMLNPVRQANVTCEICTTPISPRYWACLRCAEDLQKAENGTPIATRVIPLTYAVYGQQSNNDMHHYKDPMPHEVRIRTASYQRIQLLVAGFASAHAKCLDRVSSKPVTHVSCVPSLSGRCGRHPLAYLSDHLPQHWKRVELHAGRKVPERERREVQPDHFTLAESGAVKDKHVVVFDDTWVRGGHAQSAASTVMLAGAAEVSIVVIARRVDPNFQRSLLEQSLSEVLRSREYTLEICPITGGACPPPS